MTAVQAGTAHRLLHLVATEQASGRLPSVVAGVVRNGSLVWSGTRGDSVTGVRSGAATPSTQYRIGSITKTLTAVLVMQLRDSGRLGLDDRLEAHLPGTAYGGATLRSLLCHRGGLPAEPPLPWWERSPGVSAAELAERLDPDRLPRPPYEQYHYSNLAYALLGRVVERCTGTSWAEALAERLLRPLEMAATTQLPAAGAATGFSVAEFAGTLTVEPAFDSAAMAPAGQVWSTVADLARYAAFLADPDPAVLSPDTLDEMTVVHSGAVGDLSAGAYGLGLRLALADDRTVVGHTGSMPGFLAGLFVDRARRTAALCLANATAGLRCQDLPVALLTELERCEPTLPPPWEPAESVEPALAELLGLWHWGEVALVFTAEHGRLRVRGLTESGPGWVLRRDGVDGWLGVSGYVAGERLVVVRREDGAISHLDCATFVLTRRPYDPAAPIPGGAPELPR